MHLDMYGGVFLSSAMFAERDRRRVLQIARDTKCLHPEVLIIFSSTHLRKPRVFEYVMRAGRAKFQVYLKNIVLYKAALSNFLCENIFSVVFK